VPCWHPASGRPNRARNRGRTVRRALRSCPASRP